MAPKTVCDAHGLLVDNLAEIKEGQKQALLDGFGVSRFREADEMITALAGFSGYSTYKTAHYQLAALNFGTTAK